MTNLHLFVMAYNEELFLQYMIDHYRKNFPGCFITVYDNQSTDRTAEIARLNNCEVLEFNTNNQIDDFKTRELKNNCWKGANTDWVLVCDVDELLDINEEQLKKEELNGTTIIKSIGFNMVNMNDDYNFDNIKYGTRVPQYDKYYLFSKKNINEILYQCGGHSASPRGNIKLSETAYKLYHYKGIHPDYLIARFKWTAKRLSQNNIKHGMGLYWLNVPEEKIRADFECARQGAIKIKD